MIARLLPPLTLTRAGRPAFFAVSHLARELALVYQRYIFFGTLGAAAFGLASMGVAPALFFVTFLTMVTGELVIGLHARADGAMRVHALKYVLVLEIAGAAAGVALLAAAALLLPERYASLRTLMFVSLAVIPASAFSQIAVNWALLGGRRSLYALAFYVESILILATSRWLVDTFGLYSVVLAYCLRPLSMSVCVVVGMGFGRIAGGVRRAMADGSTRIGRTVHARPAHQVGSLVIKSAWSSLDVLMVGSLAGDAGAGHYRILKTLASVPSVAISPVWAWLRPTIARLIHRADYRALARLVLRYSALLSVPAVLMAPVPASWFGAVYHWLFPLDRLDSDILKLSMILWWLVASASGWARSITVATGQLQVSTWGNLIAFFGTFLAGPVIVLTTGFNPLLVVPTVLVSLTAYWLWYLARLYTDGPAAFERAAPAGV